MKTFKTDAIQVRKLLLIVDPQIDFITGSLPVPGATDAMNRLADYVKEEGKQYDAIIVTADRHRFGHCSFNENGGEWPRHCVESSIGAAIWPALMDALQPFASRLTLLYKGESDDHEEYSIFNNGHAAAVIDNIITRKEREQGESVECIGIDICGLAGDVCVAHTLEDAMRLYPDVSFNILTDCTASLDSGRRISSLKSTLRPWLQ